MWLSEDRYIKKQSKVSSSLILELILELGVFPTPPLQETETGKDKVM